MHSFPEPAAWSHLEWAVMVVAAWLLVGIAGVFALRRFSLVARVLFPAGGILSLVMFAIALSAVFSPHETLVLPIGLPGCRSICGSTAWPPSS